MHRRLISAALVGALATTVLVPSIALAQSLRGSSSAVARAYERASDRGLYFYKTAGGVLGAAAKGRFVRLNGNAGYRTHSVTHPYVTATTRTFVERLGTQYRNACGQQLVVTSAIRPLTGQPANSSTRSVHPTGTAVDLRRPTGACLTWLRRTLLALEKRGVIDATEERSPPHFHVAVFTTAYERYLVAQGVRTAPARAVTVTTASTPDSSSSPRVALATVARVAPASSPSRGAAARSTRRYTVRPGDSYWSIAQRFDTSVTALQRANPASTTRILPGQKLVIPQ